MNRKIQDSDRLFIVALYKRDPYAFNAHTEAEKYGVSIVTIYNVLAQAGVKMRRGRKPACPPEAPPTLRLEFSIPDDVDKDEADRLIGEIVQRSNELHHAMGGNGLKFEDTPAPLISPPPPKPLNPLDMLNLVDHLNHPKPPVTPKGPSKVQVRSRQGPPVIRPKIR